MSDKSKIKELIGKKIVEVIPPWEGENEESEMQIKFEDGTVLEVLSVYCGEPGMGSPPNLDYQIHLPCKFPSIGKPSK